jgi:energy-coupling factor transport system ATP-binding protein
MIELDRVSYTYPGAPAPVIAGLSLTIADGEFLLVCGPSGAGKSTFLRLLNGLVPHFYGGVFGGEVRVDGRSTRHAQPRDLADAVGFVFQDPEAQFVVEVVEDEIVFGMENLGLAPRLMRRRVEEVLDQLGIAHLRRRRIATLSGGERQRVAIAAALAAQPRTLVLDEPTSQIDPHGAEEVLTALQKLNADLGLTIVLSEHRLERVVQYADRILYVSAPDKEIEAQESAGIDAADQLPASSVPGRPVLGPPREVLARVALAPPLVRLGRRLGWSPLPLTIKEGRRFVHAGAQAGGQDPGASSRKPRADSASPITRHVSHGTPAVVVSRLHVSYGTTEALYGLSLTAGPGEVLALMGRNGSGKTTLLKAIIGLVRPRRGTVTLLGRDIAGVPVEELAGLAGYVPQDPRALLFHDTLREELEFTLASRQAGRKTQDERRKQAIPDRHTLDLGTTDLRPSSFVLRPSETVEHTLDLLGLGHLAGAYPRDLSGGEAQRAALAAVLVADPPVLLLDEPTRGLDYAAKAALGALLRRLAAGGRTIIMATHDVELVAACADRVALLGDGELVVEGPVREVLSDSLVFSPQIAKLFPGTGWLTAEDVPR